MGRRLAIVMGRNYASRLGMIRAAGEAGCDVAVIQIGTDVGKGKKPVDAYSRYITAGYLASPGFNTEQLIALLNKRFAGLDPKPVLLPTDDYTASVVDLNLDRLKDGFLMPGIQGETGRTVYYMDKAVQKALAQKAGFEVARGWTATWSNGSYAIPEDVTFPCFIKPEVSFKGAKKQSMQRCDTRAQLVEALARIDGREDYPILIEQFIDIEGEYDIPGLALEERIVVPGIIRKREIYMGVTASGTMLPMEDFPQIKEKIERFMAQFGFTGLIDIELLESGGVYYFNELNLRFGASGFAMTGSGINLPGMLIGHLYGDDIPEDVRLAGRKTFASEKVLIQELSSGKLTLEEYRRQISDVDFTFVGWAKDPGPYRAFHRDEPKTVIKAWIKRLLRR